ncbi:MAG TPA: MFS transporter [Burkholderiales bacterium]
MEAGLPAIPLAAAPGAAKNEAAAPQSIETRKSWLIAVGVTLILMFSYGAPLANTVALKSIAAEFGNHRTIPSLAASFIWLGSGIGSIFFGRLIGRIGFRVVAMIGAASIGIGLIVSSMGGATQFLIGHILFVGLLGSGAINVHMLVFISRWFDKRRGAALALVTSGQYISGTIWPSFITAEIDAAGWRQAMMWTGIVTCVGIVPLAWFALQKTPSIASVGAGVRSLASRATLRGVSHRRTFVLLCVAGFCCCTPMAMPAAHLVALCGDFGISPKTGALMLSTMLASAFISRQFWGWMSDRIGGIRTILCGSTFQVVAMVAFALTQSEYGLFITASAFGLGFAGIIPAYVLAIREIFPESEANWRTPIWFFSNLCGMAFGSWVAGYIYDHYLSYGPAFYLGIFFNIGNIALIGWLVSRQTMGRAHQVA